MSYENNGTLSERTLSAIRSTDKMEERVPEDCAAA